MEAPCSHSKILMGMGFDTYLLASVFIVSVVIEVKNLYILVIIFIEQFADVSETT